MKILNLYAGIGGNRKLWPEDCEVTAVEIEPSIAAIYQTFFPKDKVIIADAHQYLLEHYKEFDFIWSSPPCPTHSRMRLLCAEKSEKRFYPDMKLYEEILFLKHWFKGKWVVENVVSYYDPLIKPFLLNNHYFWSNFVIDGKSEDFRGIIRMSDKDSIKHKEDKFGIDLSEFDLNIRFKVKILNNCVNPNTGLFVFNCAFRTRQEVLL
jgi:DNA (cytosine-5)-methyltransferase 1